MPVRLNSTGGGSVTLDVPATAGTFTVNLPAANGDVVVTGSGSTVQFGAGSVSAPSITFSGDTNTGIYSPAADTIAFTEGGVEAMRLDASGNVGIGTSVPTSKLHVAGGSGSTIRNTASSGSSWFVGSNVDSYILHNESNTPMLFTTNGTERARISSNGTLSLNTTSTTVNSKTPLLLAFQTSTSPAISCRVGSTGPSNQMTFHNPNGEVGTINTDGFNTAFGTSSDYRLKENVAPLANAAERVRALKPCRFNFIGNPGRTVDGFIAHEAAEVVPEAVIGEKDAVHEGGAIKPQGIDQSKLVPLLTAALQEALSRIETLEARLAAVEAR